MIEALTKWLLGPILLVLDSTTTANLFPKTISPNFRSTSCDTIQYGYQCRPELTHFWGQYSPFFSVPSEISPAIPTQCTVTFAQVLSRHGARYPTRSKTDAYNHTISKIQRHTKQYSQQYAFLKDYLYDLGAEDLTPFGQQELINSGVKFYERYQDLALNSTPFVRAASQERVVMSAQNWTQGFHLAKSSGHGPDPDYPYTILQLLENLCSNNTLSNDLCTTFRNPPYSRIGSAAQAQWIGHFIHPIMERLNAGLPGANLNSSDTINMMDLCPYNTVDSPVGAISQFCDLFTIEEWRQYDYLQSLEKYYGHGNGNPFASTQGIGFANELIARLTGKPVVDDTSTNHTLDENSTTFPRGERLYADFSHDNDMVHVFAALGLYNSTAPLSNVTLETTQQTKGFSAAYVVPFAARVYFEKLSCSDYPDGEMVRVIMNDRVLPLETCGGDALGRCTLESFVDSLTFVKEGGLWNQCRIEPQCVWM